MITLGLMTSVVIATGLRATSEKEQQVEIVAPTVPSTNSVFNIRGKYDI